MQDEHGQVEEAHSISAGLDYPGVGPEHSYLARDRPGRVPAGHRRRGARRVHAAGPHRGHHRRLRAGPRHRLGGPRGAVARRARRCSCACPAAATRTSPRRWTSSAPDARRADVATMEEHFRAARAAGRKLLVPYITGGYPGWEDAVRAAAANGADGIEIGIPFSDPVMDGPVIQQASQAALDAGATPPAILDAAADARRRHPARRDDVLQPRPPRRPPPLRRPPRRRRHRRAASCPTCRSRSPGRGARRPTTPASRRSCSPRRRRRTSACRGSSPAPAGSCTPSACSA